jgi:GGDEF domain-containing protein
VGRLELQGRELAALVAERTCALAEANAELARLAATLPGTGLANRRRLEEHLDEEWRRACRAKSSVGVLMVDVDHFKAYNDRYGHPRGEEALAQVAGVLRQAVRRAGDLAGRYGGEEFAVVLAGSGVDDRRPRHRERRWRGLRAGCVRDFRRPRSARRRRALRGQAAPQPGPGAAGGAGIGP